MNWFYLFIAGLFEIVWAIGLKYTAGFTRLWPSVVTIGAMIAGFHFLSLALKTIPIGTAYAVWTGIGVIGTVILGMVFLKESCSIVRIICVMMILFGIVGLKLVK